jgi:hypothetical protein
LEHNAVRCCAVFLLLLVCAGGAAIGLTAQTVDRPESVALDMSEWHRRDYDRCRGAGRVITSPNTLTLEVDDSALKYWQLPSLLGPLEVNRRAGWIRRCDRPPASFATEMLKRTDPDALIEIVEYPFVSWRWSVDGTLDDSETVDSEGRVQSRGDDFAAKVGFQMMPRGSDELREIAYVWTRTIPREEILLQEAGALFWKFRFYRIVAESGDEHIGLWRDVTRNLRADYQRIWPDEEPGILLRVFLMTDGDNTNVRASASYGDIVLHRSPPRFEATEQE